MKAIQIRFSKSDDELFGQSKWWGVPDLPETWDYPEMTDEDGESLPLNFICQIRCSDLALVDTENLLPHTGMLYFFAAIDEYIEDDADRYSCPFQNGMGEWSAEAYKVFYTPETDSLSPLEVVWEDGQSFHLPAEAILFEAKNDSSTLEYKLLGRPTMEEMEQGYEDYLNLLQVDENDRWHLRIYDVGIINFLIKPEDLRQKKFDKVVVYLESC